MKNIAFLIGKYSFWFVVIGMSLVFIVKNLLSSYEIFLRKDMIVEKQLRLKQLEAEQDELKSQLSERLSDEFIEKEARNKLGFVKEGETLVILPKKEEDLSSKEKSSASNEVFGEEVSNTEELSPLQQWLRLFL